MSDDPRKANKQYTGTVPKIKYRNNTSSYGLNEQERTRSLSNNLSTPWHQQSDNTNFIRNPRRNPQNNYNTMDTTAVMDEQNALPLQNGMQNFTNSMSLTPNTSSSASRRNSGGSILKCDNVTKYPDKKQIEAKLSQIREYLQISSSLMNSMKNTDEQSDSGGNEEKCNLAKMINDLRDSEQKLLNILEEFNGDEESAGPIIVEVIDNGIDSMSENSASSSKQRNEFDVNNLDSQELDTLREQQLVLMKLQQKAENKLRDARLVQDKLYVQSSNDSNQKATNNISMADFDAAIQEIEERTKRLKHPRQDNVHYSEKILNEVDRLHNNIMTMHQANNEREQLIEVLDNRDTVLRSQQAELRSKLVDLQKKKQHVDQLVAQLQHIDEDDGSDVGTQVRKIVTMKDQLKQLKDMLEIVKTSENEGVEAQAAALDVCLNADTFLQNQIQKQRSHESNVATYDNNAVSNGTRPKQTNKNPRDPTSRNAKSKTSIANKQAALQAELKAKKKELEDIMGKHKASSSNLNHDIGIDTKSEFSCTSNTNSNTNALNDASWRPFVPQQATYDINNDTFSSDNCDEDEEFPVVNEETNDFPAALTMNTLKRLPENNSEYVFPTLPSRSPDRNLRGSSVATSSYVREQPRYNNEQEKLQKQLQLIKNVCDSMMAQQNSQSNANQPNVHQVRNNLTPSSIYSEPNNSHALNVVNAAAAGAEMPWIGPQNPHSQVDVTNYQSWLATNTLQTQSFMLNTLNQCCQMLWLQQRELASLRSTVTTLQERLIDSNSHLIDAPLDQPLPPPPPPPPQSIPLVQPPCPPPITNNQYRPKPSHVSAACSLPNLNAHYNVPNVANQEHVFNHVYTPSSNQSIDALSPNQQRYHSANQQRYNLHANYVPFQTSSTANQCLLNNTHVNNANNNSNSVAATNHNNNNNTSNSSNSSSVANQSGDSSLLHANQINPSMLWSGSSTALNNQVAPGNRANNYWDNFRSYSRQNLLSTKNNETLQQSVDRTSTNAMERSQFSLIFSKSNSEMDSGSTSQEHTPQRRKMPYKPPRHVDNVTPPQQPPDVLNVNNQSHVNVKYDRAQAENCEDLGAFRVLIGHPNDVRHNENIVDIEPREAPRRNEWNSATNASSTASEMQEERPQKNKLFDELRDNVYKEVASLISANEARPHFLIQLFRDLQLIGSDSLRLKILQSIQRVVTNSMLSAHSSNRQSFESQQSTRESEDNLSLQSTVWSKPFLAGPRNIMNLEIDRIDVQNAFKDLIPMLNDNEEQIITKPFLLDLKQLFLESASFKETVRDTIFQKHFSNVLDEVLEQYIGKKVHDIKLHLIQTVSELLKGELSFIQLIQETNPDNCLQPPDGVLHGAVVSMNQYEGVAPPVNVSHNIEAGNMQNGDLAEADQSRLVVEEDIEEEGAVGGVLEVTQEMDVKPAVTQGNSEEILSLPIIEFPCNVEGLDQVPTRLPTKIKSRSTTPTKDRNNPDGDSF